MDEKLVDADHSGDEKYDMGHSDNDFTFDLCMVFRQYIQSEQEIERGDAIPVPRLTAPMVVTALEEAGLRTRMYKSANDKCKEVYCLIGAPESRLEVEAERIEYDLKLNKTSALEYGAQNGMRLALKTINRDLQSSTLSEDLWENIYVRYNKECHEIYEKYTSTNNLHQDSIFRTVDRIKLTISIVEADQHFNGAGISISKAKATKHSHLIAMFPLHERGPISHMQDRFKDRRVIWKMPLEEIRHYFGEEIGMYFAFLQFYNRWLFPMTIVGIIFFGLQCAYGIADAPLFWVVGIIVVVWATIFLEFWKRNEANLRVRWGMIRFEDKEQTRPEYSGDWIRSPIDGRLQEIFPAHQKFLRAMMSQSVLLTMLGMVVGLVIAIVFLRQLLVNKYDDWGKYLTSFINAIQIMIFNAIFTKIALYLNEFENHRTDTEYSDSLIAKNFAFKFINSYNSLFWYAFVRYFYETEALACDTSEECLEDLAYSLGIVFFTIIFVNNLREVYLPYLFALFDVQHLYNRRRGEEEEDVSAFPTTTPEEEFKLAAYPSTMADYDELVVQFGYVVLFCLAFPLTFTMGFVNNILEVGVDGGKLCNLYRRPEPRGAGDIGTWMIILQIVCCIAVVTNVAIACIFSSQINNWVNGSALAKVFIGVIAEHILLGTKLIIGVAIPDESLDVRAHAERENYIENVLISGAAEEDELAFELVSQKSMRIDLDNLPDFFHFNEVPDVMEMDDHIGFAV